MPQKKASASSNKGGSLPLRKGYILNPYSETPRTYEKRRGKKLTIPDQSLTIKEILKRHTHGLRIPDAQVGGYYDDGADALQLDGVNWDTLDISEKHEVYDRLLKESLQTQRRYKSEQEKIKRANQLSKMKEELTKELSKQKDTSQHIDS